MVKKLIGISAILLIIAGITWVIMRDVAHRSDGWKAIPGDAAFILEINDPSRLIKTLTAENDIWTELTANDHFSEYHQAVLLFDSLLNILSFSNLLPGIAIVPGYRPKAIIVLFNSFLIVTVVSKLRALRARFAVSVALN